MGEFGFSWWIWVVAGLGLMALEAFTPAGFYLFFIGLASLFTGALTAIGIAPTLLRQGMAILLGMAVVLSLRKSAIRAFRLAPPADEVDSLTGQTAVAMTALAPGGAGKVELRGSAWTARNIGTSELAAGSPCRVERVEGLTLEVRQPGA